MAHLLLAFKEEMLTNSYVTYRAPTDSNLWGRSIQVQYITGAANTGERQAYLTQMPWQEPDNTLYIYIGFFIRRNFEWEFFITFCNVYFFMKSANILNGTACTCGSTGGWSIARPPESLKLKRMARGQA